MLIDYNIATTNSGLVVATGISITGATLMHLLITSFFFFLVIKKRYPCLLLPGGRTHKLLIFLFPDKNK